MVDVSYTPPLQDPTECGYLELNYINCLKEKAAGDVVPYPRECNNEQIVWFNLECPDKWARFNDPVRLRSIFIKDKLFEKTPMKPRFYQPQAEQPDAE